MQTNLYKSLDKLYKTRYNVNVKKEAAKMKKSVYSIVLSDNVISEIDKIAYMRHTNRSNLINQVLAEYVSYTTPEKNIENVFRRMAGFFEDFDGYRLQKQTSDKTLAWQTALSFKYNPTVHYAVELYRDISSGSVGVLKVSVRTHNPALIGYMTEFFKLWSRIESAYCKGYEYYIGEGRFSRTLGLAGNDDFDVLADRIINYVNAFDDAMKRFFSLLDDADDAVRSVEKAYERYISEYGAVV